MALVETVVPLGTVVVREGLVDVETVAVAAVLVMVTVAGIVADQVAGLAVVMGMADAAIQEKGVDQVVDWVVGLDLAAVVQDQEAVVAVSRVPTQVAARLRRAAGRLLLKLAVVGVVLFLLFPFLAVVGLL